MASFGIDSLGNRCRVIKSTSWLKFIFFIALCVSKLFQGFSTGGVAKLTIVDMEKRYGIDSVSIAFILGAYDVGAMILSPFVGFIADKADIRLVITSSVLLSAVGNMLYTLPHFYSDFYAAPFYSINGTEKKDTFDNLCSDTAHKAPLGSNEKFHLGLHQNISHFSFGQFYLGQFLMGIGACSVHTLTPIYVENTFGHKDSPNFIAFYTIMSILGPSLGFMSTSEFLKYWVDFPFAPQGEMNEPHWIGAWWLGFAIVSGILIFCFSVMQFVLIWDKRKSITAKLNLNSKTLITSNEITEQKDNNECFIFCDFTDLFKPLKYLITHPFFMMYTIGVSLKLFYVAARFTFMAKSVEAIFGVRPRELGLYAGSVTLIPTIIGLGVGSRIMKWIDRNSQYTLMIATACISPVLNLITSSIYISSIGCSSLDVSGFSLTSFQLNQSKWMMNSHSKDWPLYDCNSNCNCPSIYAPICGVDSQVYASPCHAGCQTALANDNYKDCKCIINKFKNESAIVPDAVEGECTNRCHINSKIWFLCAFFCESLIHYIFFLPELYLILRFIPHQYKTYAYGMKTCIFKVTSLLPSPLLFGYLMDNTCLVWSASQHNNTPMKHCAVYALNQFRMLHFIYIVVFCSASLIFLVPLVYMQYKGIIGPVAQYHHLSNSD